MVAFIKNSVMARFIIIIFVDERVYNNKFTNEFSETGRKWIKVLQVPSVGARHPFPGHTPRLAVH